MPIAEMLVDLFVSQVVERLAALADGRFLFGAGKDGEEARRDGRKDGAMSPAWKAFTQTNGHIFVEHDGNTDIEKSLDANEKHIGKGEHTVFRRKCAESIDFLVRARFSH